MYSKIHYFLGPSFFSSNNFIQYFNNKGYGEGEREGDPNPFYSIGRARHKEGHGGRGVTQQAGDLWVLSLGHLRESSLGHAFFIRHEDEEHKKLANVHHNFVCLAIWAPTIADRCVLLY